MNRHVLVSKCLPEREREIMYIVVENIETADDEVIAVVMLRH